ncbi:MAG: serine/threonine-protein phosphatase [Anaerolineaceae bacterium]|nr:serine/threonine-protein phosphatase [Anaerolineaceae bacterium]
MKRIQESAFPVIARSHPGSTGKNNEDRFAVSAYQSERHPHIPVLVAVISDGIGGHRGGEIASEMSVNHVTQFLAQGDIHTPLKSLCESIKFASNKIFQDAESENGIRGMGATVAATWIIGKRLYTSHVGDSRIYLIRDHHIHQLSLDHSWVQEAIDLGIIEESEAKRHPNAHVIRRYLGSPQPPDVDQRLFYIDHQPDNIALQNQGFPLLPDDRILLTTDGITDLIVNNELLDLFENGDIEEAVSRTIDLANQRGGYDNLSIIAIEIPPQSVVGNWFNAYWPKILMILGLTLLLLLLGSLIWLIKLSVFSQMIPENTLEILSLFL